MRAAFALGACAVAIVLPNVTGARAATAVGPLRLETLDPPCWRYPSPAGVWPLAPIHQAHPIRGGFNDIRAAGQPHFGVDIEARDRAAVYAITSGVLSGFTSMGTGMEHFLLAGRYQYWHVTPLPGLGSGSIVAAGQEIGHVWPRLRHVHVSEIVPGCAWIDPRRPGGVLHNSFNRERPTIGSISAFRADGRAYQSFPPTPYAVAGSRWTVVDDTGPVGDPATPILLDHLSGRIDFRAPVSDLPRFAASMFPQQPLMVAGVRSYLAPWGRPGEAVTRVVTAFDGVRLIPSADFFSVFAYGTRRIKACFDEAGAHCSASWVIHTARRGIATRNVPDGQYLYCVQAVTITNVSAHRCAPVRIQNHASGRQLLRGPQASVAPVSTLAPSLAYGRYGLSAARTATGNIVVMGGYSRLAGWLRSVQRYSPAHGSWTALPPLPRPRFAAAAAVGSNGGIYDIGGYSPTLGDTRTVDRYDPHTRRWSAVAPIPVGRRYLSAVSDAGRIYAIGGYNAQTGAVRGMAVYDPRHGRWLHGAALPVPEAGAASAVGADGRIYLFGGWDEAHGIMHRTQIYDPRRQRWTFGAAMPVHREAGAAVTAGNGCIYVMGGDTTETGSLTVLRQVDVYNPGTNRWTIAAPMLRRRRSLAAALGTRKIYAIAGYDTSRGALHSVERFASSGPGC